MKGLCAEDAMLVARQTAGRISRIRFSTRASLALIGSTPMAVLRNTRCQSASSRHFVVSPFNFLGFRDCATEDKRLPKPLSRATVCPESRTPPQNRTPIVRGVPASGNGAAMPRQTRQRIHQDAGAPGHDRSVSNALPRLDSPATSRAARITEIMRSRAPLNGPVLLHST